MKARSDKVAVRYGGVLFDLAHQENAVKAILKDINTLQDFITTAPQDWVRVISPSLPLFTQHKIIERLLKVLKIGKIMSRFLRVLCQNRRLPHLKAILEEFLEQMKRAEGIREGTLQTSIELSQKEVKSLQNALAAQLGEKIHLTQDIKENLLGGVVLRIGSLMIDASTRTRLAKLHTAMKG